MQLIKNASLRNGGVYVYSNLKGCDGGRIYFDGASLISLNGKIITQLPQFSLKEVEVDLAAVDMDMVRRYRTTMNSRAL